VEGSVGVTSKKLEATLGMINLEEGDANKKCRGKEGVHYTHCRNV